MSSLQATAINVPDNIREEVSALLNARVGLFADLYIQVKLAHWNVRGPHFIAYHQLFDDIADHVLEAQDSMAERAATLGATAGMTVQQISRESDLASWPLGVREDREVIRLVGERLGHAANLIRHDIDAVGELADQDSADLLTEVSRQLDKDLWFVEAHYQE